MDKEEIKNKLSKEWDYKKNVGLSLNDFSFGSHKKAWWKCVLGHSWEAEIKRRYSGSGCPYCANKKLLIGYNDLATTNPELAKEWNYQKNDIKPEDVTSGADKKVWWICEKGHEWRALIKNRKLGQICPYCSNTKVLSGYNDLATTHPKLAKEWHPSRNGKLKPTDILAGSNKFIWWKCEKGHEWKTKSLYRSMGENCPFCQNRNVLSGYNDLATTNPELLKEWDFDKNEIKPDEIVGGSSIKVWWICKKGHNYKSTINGRTSGHGCPKCVEELRTSLPERIIYFYIKKYFNDAMHNYCPLFLEKKELDIYIPSLNVGIEYDGQVFHKLEKDLIKDKICSKNNVLLYRIREKNCVRYDSTSIKIYLEENNNNSLEKAIIDLLNQFNVINSDINIERDLDKIYLLIDYMDKENSIAKLNPELSKEWNYDKNGNMLPENFSVGSHYKVWWICEKGHEWRAEIKSRCTGRSCPYCSNNKLLKNYNDLATTNPELLKEWDFDKNEIKPDEVMSGSEKKVWWRCSKCGKEWETMIKTRKRGSGCPKCNGGRNEY